jgi:hypothetical protein
MANFFIRCGLSPVGVAGCVMGETGLVLFVSVYFGGEPTPV